MKIINPERFQRLIHDAQNANFSGWEFNWLEGRMIQENPTWDYRAIVTDAFSNANSLLDLGTGGGELLASFAPLPPDTHVTESYLPNQALAQERLSPLGVEVHATQTDQPLPFSDNRFDLVISRHESYDAQEVCRVLKPGGLFITQQVGGLDNLELNQVLEDDLSFPYTKWGLAAALTGLYETDFLIERAEQAALVSKFIDIGAVVYYLKAIPWQVEGFSVKTHYSPLVQLHNIIERQGEFLATAHRFLILARKEVGFK